MSRLASYAARRGERGTIGHHAGPSHELIGIDNAMPPRNLGLVVLRGPNVVLISPTDGSAGTCCPLSYHATRESCDSGGRRSLMPAQRSRTLSHSEMRTCNKT